MYNIKGGFFYLMEHNANRGYKDSVFSLYMRNPDRLIESYNAIQGENYALDTRLKLTPLTMLYIKNGSMIFHSLWMDGILY